MGSGKKHLCGSDINTLRVAQFCTFSYRSFLCLLVKVLGTFMSLTGNRNKLPIETKKSYDNLKTTIKNSTATVYLICYVHVLTVFRDLIISFSIGFARRTIAQTLRNSQSSSLAGFLKLYGGLRLP